MLGTQGSAMREEIRRNWLFQFHQQICSKSMNSEEYLKFTKQSPRNSFYWVNQPNFENLIESHHIRKSTLLNEILYKSPYISMSNLFRKVMTEIIMTFEFESYDYVEVPPSTVGLVVGIKGITIKYIQDMTDTKIITPSKEMQPIFMIFGEKESVYHAKSAISNYVEKKVMPEVMKKNAWFGEKLIKKYKKIKKLPEYQNDNIEIYNNNITEDDGNINNSLHEITISKQSNNGDLDNFYYKDKKINSNKQSNETIEPKSDEQVKTTTRSLLECVSEGQKNEMSRLYREVQLYKSKKKIDFEDTSTNSVTESFKEDKPFCMMCFSEEQFEKLLPCGNGPFCRECSLKVLETNNICPICNSKVINKTIWDPNSD